MTDGRRTDKVHFLGNIMFLESLTPKLREEASMVSKIVPIAAKVSLKYSLILILGIVFQPTDIAGKFLRNGTIEFYRFKNEFK